MLQGRLCERATVQFDPGASVEPPASLRTPTCSTASRPRRRSKALTSSACDRQRASEAASPGDRRQLGKPLGLLQFGDRRRVRPWARHIRDSHNAVRCAPKHRSENSTTGKPQASPSSLR